MSGMASDLPVCGSVPVAQSRQPVIAALAFLTVVDLFATQAILPALVEKYGVSPAAMGTAVNASTLGMTVSGLAVALFAHRLDRRRGATLALALLSIPTALLAIAPGLVTFTLLRVVQGLLMAAAFTLTLAQLAEATSGRASGAAFAIGFSILFAFVGTFTYVNFVLVRPRIPAVDRHHSASRPARGPSRDENGAPGALSIAGVGLPVVLASHLSLVLVGLALFAVGTFPAQAVATGFVGSAAAPDAASASGL